MIKKIFNNIFNNDRRGKNSTTIPNKITQELLKQTYPIEQNTENQIFKATDLLDAIIELERIHTHIQYWDENQLFNSNHPRFYRLIRIRALSMAFFNHSDNNFISAITNGKFISNFTLEERRTIFKKTSNIFKSSSSHYDPKRKINYELQFDPSHLKLCFNHLFRFKHKLLSFIDSGGIEASSYLFVNSVLFANRIKSSVDKELVDQLDQILEIFLNPNANTFSRKTLEEEYSFPKVDLKQVDIEWW